MTAEGMLPTSNSRRWICAVLVLAAAAAAAVAAVQLQTQTDRWVSHTYQVIAGLERLQARLTDAETKQRGFLLTGDESELLALKSAGSEVDDVVESLRELTVDNPVQQARIPALHQAAMARLKLLNEVARIRRDLPNAPLSVKEIEEGRRYMNEVREHVEAMRAVEQRLLEERLVAAERGSWLGMAATVGTGVLSVALLLTLHLTSVRHARQLEEAYNRLSKSAAELEHRVQTRTAELADANDTLQGFAHTIAHDLRAPLRNMQGFATALLEDEADRLSAEGADYLKRLSSSAGRLDVMITDLLAYSRLARQAVKVQVVDLKALLHEICKELAPQIEQTHATFAVQANLPSVMAHPTTLKQALTNLMANALKFVLPNVPPRVTIAARRRGARVEIDVSDEGIGIAQEHQDRIFGVFERLHGPDSYPGTGIGLAIVRKAIERMGGHVRVRSVQGAGATFTIDLPVAQEATS